ncbi:EAL domain-containing protein [Gammaproteobacteria bacterium AS21]
MKIVNISLLCLILLPINSFALDKVKLQLKYLHQFQFAGYYAALEQGFYRQAGLDVEIIEGLKGDEPLIDVISGKAQFGVGSSSLILEHSKGEPVVVLGVVFQHSPYTLLMPKFSDNQSIHDIVGKKVMIADQADELIAYLNKESIALDSLTLLPHSFDASDLISGKVEGFSAYTTNETGLLDRKKFRYQSFSPRSAGIDFYGDNLFTSEQLVDNNPELVDSFLKASMRGWVHAFDHPNKTIDLILEKYSKRNTKQHLFYEYQQMVPLVQPKLVDMGYMNPGRWQHIANTYADLNMLAEGYQFDGFIYNSHPQMNMTKWYVSFACLLFAMLTISTLHYRNRAKERLIAKQQIEFKNTMLSTQQEAAVEGMLVINDDERIISANQRFMDLWSIDKAVIDRGDDSELLAIVVKYLSHPEAFLTRIKEIRNQRELICTEEISLKDGRTMERYTAPMISKEGQYFGRLWSFRDITARKKATLTIWNQANLDFLTGLPNRYFFINKLESAIGEAERKQCKLALLFLDLDRFKEVNDTLGHHVGDKLIQQTAKRLLTCAAENDTVSRLGGDEFTIILSGLSNLDRVEKIANDVLHQLSLPFKIDNEQVYISTSIGITIYPADGVDTNTLIKNADQAMYTAKDKGRDKFQYFTFQMQEQAKTRLNLIHDIRLALNDNQFILHYQPIICFTTREIVKAEALIRWNHPERGLIGPDYFIPIAEETGMINQIGNWVFETAIQKLQYWRDHYNQTLQISINISPAQFDIGGGIDSWIQKLAALKLPGDALILEITEGLLMEPRQQVSDRLLEFSNAGINVALDDFGTGYSSLAYLNRFDIDYLKIDKAFVCNLKPKSNDLALCEAIIVMAHKLEIKVIAEGIETPQQLSLLTQIGCEFGQGYYISKPIAEEEFENLLINYSSINTST